MRYFLVFQAVALFFGAGLAQAGPLQAAGKYIWGPPSVDPVRPYLEEGKIPHNSQWADDQWSPQDWIEDRGSAKAVMDGLYSSGIITDQYTEDGIPVLEVGQRFLELSDQEKRRVASFVDVVFGITRQSGLYLIYFHKNDIPVGLFTVEGLQLQ